MERKVFVFGEKHCCINATRVSSDGTVVLANLVSNTVHSQLSKPTFTGTTHQLHSTYMYMYVYMYMVNGQTLLSSHLHGYGRPRH